VGIIPSSPAAREAKSAPGLIIGCVVVIVVLLLIAAGIIILLRSRFLSVEPANYEAEADVDGHELASATSLESLNMWREKQQDSIDEFRETAEESPSFFFGLQ
jgi:hypothetical protein